LLSALGVVVSLIGVAPHKHRRLTRTAPACVQQSNESVANGQN